MDQSVPGAGPTPAVPPLRLPGQELVSLPDVVRIIVVQGAIAALVTGLSTVFISIMLEYPEHSSGSTRSADPDLPTESTFVDPPGSDATLLTD